MSAERFADSWLRLREPVDHRARDEGLVAQLAARWRGRRHVRIVDLGCGRGSNLRYLAPRLDVRQSWVLVDHDVELLTAIEPPASVDGLERVATDLGAFLDGEGFPGGSIDCLTASALLDLVSDDWVRRLVDVCRTRASPALLTLSYDGRIEWLRPGAQGAAPGARVSIATDDDRMIRDAVNEHQRRDKGLGLSLGPTAGQVTADHFRQAGYRVTVVQTPWHLTAEDASLTTRLIQGWSEAAMEVVPDRRARIRRWADGRRGDACEGRVELSVGHVDLLATPGES